VHVTRFGPLCDVLTQLYPSQVEYPRAARGGGLQHGSPDRRAAVSSTPHQMLRIRVIARAEISTRFARALAELRHLGELSSRGPGAAPGVEICLPVTTSRPMVPPSTVVRSPSYFWSVPVLLLASPAPTWSCPRLSTHLSRPRLTNGPGLSAVVRFLPTYCPIWACEPARPTWSSTPHSPAEVLAGAHCAHRCHY